MLQKVSLGIQVSEVRSQTAVVAAGWVGDEIHFELAAYIGGTEPVSEVLKLMAARTVSGVVVDPHSQAATTIRPLAKVGIRVIELTTSDLTVAFGDFVDGINANLPEGPNVTKVKAVRDPRLDAVMQHADTRAVGGATTWQRRGLPVDMSPLDGATFAVWAVLNEPDRLPAIY